MFKKVHLILCINTSSVFIFADGVIVWAASNRRRITDRMQSQLCRGKVNNNTDHFRVGYQIRKDGTICKQLITEKFKKTPRLVVKYFQILDY